ncbi:P-loop containing nucleoside triphosphate hydrolase protein [Amylocystis lapponica]|nr:P-loop containing nucleoside triphosphate hydrolase protein [Amylocystis lapponica]
MDQESISTHSFRFNSPEGHVLCRKILAPHFPYSPHDYQLDGVCRALDGSDILAVTPTGSGKTGFLTMYMVVARELAQNPTLCPSPAVAVKKDPAMLVVCPTKSLELDMKPKFAAAGLTTLVINADTIEQARHAHRDLWAEARSGVAAILLAPEQLKTKGFDSLIADKAFQSRVIAMGVDEVHLLVTWGAQFRPAFRQIGHMRLRLSSNPILIGLSATLRCGPPFLAVCGFLGLREGTCHFIRRSNARYDIRLLFRDMESGRRAMEFPELAWVLSGERNIIIFCSTIALGFRVTAYLWKIASHLPDRARCIRMYNALNWPSYNADTLAFMHDSSESHSRVTVATDTLAVGIDAPNTHDVVLYGDIPPDSDMVLQKVGRIRDGRGKDSRAVIYLPRNATDAARKALETPRLPAKQAKKSHPDATQMDSSIACLITAKCKVDEIDRLYDNHNDEPGCTCPSCQEHPAARRPVPCNCSGCLPELALGAPAPSGEVEIAIHLSCRIFMPAHV